MNPDMSPDMNPDISPDIVMSGTDMIQIPDDQVHHPEIL